MADAGNSSRDPSNAAPVLPLDSELFKKFMATVAVFSESYRNEPQKDKKTPTKKKKVTNKKLETLKKKSVEDKARYNKTRTEMIKAQLLEKKENAIKRVEKRKSLIQRDEKLIRTVNERLGLPSDE